MDLKNHAKELKEKGVNLDHPGGGESNRLQKIGTFLFAPVAFERYKSPGKGTPALMFRLVVLEGQDIGKVIDTDMYLTGQMYDLGTFALCMGAPEEPFDENDDLAIENIITNYFTAITGKVVQEEYNGKTYYKVKYWSKAPADKRDNDFASQEDQKNAFNQASEGWDKYVEWRKKNPRKAPGSGGGQTTRNTGRQSSNSDSSTSDDDIPF